MSTLALIALGSNLGDRKAALDAALAALAKTSGVTVRAVSRYHETAPVGGPPGQGAFLNAAAGLETTLDPFALHARLCQIETEAGRQRRVRWGERTLDLDLLTYGPWILDTPELSVPHPRMAVRRFVLAPLAEIAPDARDPLTGRTISDLLANLDRRPSYVAIRSAKAPGSLAIAREVAEKLGVEPLLRQGPADDLEALRRDAARLAERIKAGRDDPERWIVSAYHLGDEVQHWWSRQLDAIRARDDKPDRADQETLRELRDLANAIMFAAPEPTFEVRFGDSGDRSRWLGWPYPCLSFPPGSPASAVAAEILAACAATRS
jgi:2-amino-4-hydroxy-6-hydroxymethyldihydropteridine diphosphokinase